MNETICRIRAVRSENNVLWMRLLELALEHAPEQAKATLREINANDRAISELLGTLT